MITVPIELSFEGKLAENHLIDFYDASRALAGFERSLAITVHAVLNGEVIVQAPSLRGAKIYLRPPISGSWKSTAFVVAGVLYSANNIDKETPLGNLIFSAYDYVISESLGFHVDYDKTLGSQIEDLKRDGIVDEKLNQNKLDSVIDKSQNSIVDIHRPIVFSSTADFAIISSDARRVQPDLTLQTYGYISETRDRKEFEDFSGVVSSYNVNTYTGRIYIAKEGRTIPFLIPDHLRSTNTVSRFTSSLNANAIRDTDILVNFQASVQESRTGQIKRLVVLHLH